MSEHASFKNPDQSPVSFSPHSHLSRLGHEVRTPMNAILGFSQLLMNDPSVLQEHREHIQIIIQSAEKLMKLINDVLDLMRVEENRFVENHHVFNLKLLVNDVIHRANEKFDRESQLSALISDPVDFPEIISDTEPLAYILKSIIETALFYTLNGSLVLHMKTTQRRENSDIVDVCVTVTSGRLKEMNARIENFFDAFELSSRESCYFGSGLELALSRKYAEILKGKLSVKTTGKNDSTDKLMFLLDFPARASCPYSSFMTDNADNAFGENGSVKDISRVSSDVSSSTIVIGEYDTVFSEHRSALRKAILSGDMDLFSDLLDILAETQPQIAAQLRLYADRYDYDTLISILKTGSD